MPSPSPATPPPSRRNVWLLVVGLLLTAAAATIWRVSLEAPPTASTPPHEITTTTLPVAAPTSDTVGPQRQIAASDEPADDEAPARTEDPTYPFEVAFEPRNAWGFSSSVEFGVGIEGGSLQRQMTGKLELAGIVVPLRLATATWLIDDGHLRRMPAVSGQRLRIELGDLPEAPSVAVEDAPSPPSGDHRMADLAASPLAGAWFEEDADPTELTDWRMPAGIFRSQAPTFRLWGQVRTATGAPATDFCVRVTGPLTDQGLPTRNGAFEATKLHAGTYRLRAGSRLGGQADATVEVRGDTRFDLVLREGPSVRGRVVDTAGRGVAGARLLWSTSNGTWRNHAFTDDNGSFAVPDVPDEPGSLQVCVPGKAAQLPAAGRVARPGERIDLVLDRERCRSTLRVRVDVPSDLPDDQLSVRLWQQSSGLGVHLVPIGREAHVAEFGRDEVPAGSYHVQLHCPGFGVVDGGVHWIDGQGPCAIDTLALPHGTRLRFTWRGAVSPPAEREWELVRRLPTADVRIHTGGVFAGPHLLGKGDYAVHWREADGTRRQRRFSLDGNATQERITLP